MNEELKVIITAEIAKLKSGCQEAKKEIEGVSESADGGSGKVSKAFSAMGSAAGAMATAVATAVAAAAAGITALVKASVEGYAEYEQLVGGVDTLFKESSQQVQDYAAVAYKTAGLSANQYMETVTSFSASLLQSLGNDTKAAAEYADRAIIDMSDNANKMGTSMESIQNAYQGFAKQNYTMLDNLKLGYGGTQQEMYRLMQDAEKLGATFNSEFKLTEKGQLIADFADITTAIHVIQTEMGITGTTAKEASSTISGSVASAKSSWSNLVTGIADDNADLEKLINEFVDSVATAADNIIPRVEIALEGAAQLVETMLPVIIERVPAIIESVLPRILEAAVNVVQALIDGFIEAFPVLLETVTNLLPQIVDLIARLIPDITGAIIKQIPDLIKVVVDIGVQVLNSLGEIIPEIIQQVIDIIPSVIESIVSAIPQLLEAAVQFFMAIVEAIPQIIPPLIEAIPTIIKTILDMVLESIPQLLDAAVELLYAIIDAIPIIIVSLVEALPEILETLITFCIESIPELLDAAIELLFAIIDAIPQILPPLIEALPDIIMAIIDCLVENMPVIYETGYNMFLKIVEAIPQMLIELVSELAKIGKTILDYIIETTPEVLSGAADMFSGIITAANNIMKNIPGKMAEIVKSIKDNLVEKLKALMKFDWSLPKLKLPHITIHGSFSLVPPSVPTFSIQWYAKGGVFDKPTLFGKDFGLGGLGEAGAEAIVPLENNLGWLDKLAGMLDERLHGSDRPIILQVDGKTFARTSISAINELTTQTGKLDLVIA